MHTNNKKNWFDDRNILNILKNFNWKILNLKFLTINRNYCGIKIKNKNILKVINNKIKIKTKLNKIYSNSEVNSIMIIFLLLKNWYINNTFQFLTSL